MKNLREPNIQDSFESGSKETKVLWRKPNRLFEIRL